ncbi:MAG: methylmalonyl-CoA epimerase [Deltaproteobacteria bacterium]|nr:MAG: methylmalonyl-CoA epimerase [Deltaproteobacteria bacterium]
MAEIKRMDHIGIVVPDRDAAVELFRRLLMIEPSYREVVETSKVELIFFELGEVQIELLVPLCSDSEMSAFLEQTGGGLHHICYEVSSIDEVLDGLKKQGFKLIDQKPRPGSRNTLIAFVDTLEAIGCYTEYCEYRKN